MNGRVLKGFGFHYFDRGIDAMSLESNKAHPPRITIVGSGAIGSLLGAKLAAAGEIVTLIDHGSRLQELTRSGLRVLTQEGQVLAPATVTITDDYASAGPQDFVILAVKAHSIHTVVDELPHLLAPHTAVVSLQNGIPWWYFQRHPGPYQARRLMSTDPEGLIEAAISAERVIGCVAYPAATLLGNGIVQHVEGLRFTLGEPDGSLSGRCQQLSAILQHAGLKSPVISDIRSELWLKAWGALSFNPISALSHATMEDICRWPPSRQLAEAMMAEAQQVATKLGITFRHTIAKRIAGAEAVGPHKTSMLQDVESGREMELQALVGSILELAEITETPAPTIGAVYACASLLNRNFIDSNDKRALKLSLAQAQ